VSSRDVARRGTGSGVGGGVVFRAGSAHPDRRSQRSTHRVGGQLDASHRAAA
jgi:hypothetical protein